ncbi:hypothetical protein ACLB2K_072811 [Fragaria x ananassa]
MSTTTLLLGKVSGIPPVRSPTSFGRPPAISPAEFRRLQKKLTSIRDAAEVEQEAIVGIEDLVEVIDGIEDSVEVGVDRIGDLVEVIVDGIRDLVEVAESEIQSRLSKTNQISSEVVVDGIGDAVAVELTSLSEVSTIKVAQSK